MPHFVYFILSHSNVEFLERLVRTIRTQSPESTVLVHHDRSKSELSASFLSNDERVIVVTPSIAGSWGSFALVDIVLLGIRTLREASIAFDYLTLLSGADYPIRPIRDFEAVLAASGDGMMRCEDVPDGIRDRYVYAWYRLPRRLENGLTHRIIGRLAFLNTRQQAVRFQSGRVGCRIGIRSRAAPFGEELAIRKGSQWWSLSSRALDRIEEFVSRHAAYVAWFRERTLIPDEAFFHTIVLNAPDLHLASDDGRFVRWTRPGSGSPDTLGPADIPELRASRKFFARKFDGAGDLTVLDVFDADTSTSPLP